MDNVSGSPWRVERRSIGGAVDDNKASGVRHNGGRSEVVQVAERLVMCCYGQAGGEDGVNQSQATREKDEHPGAADRTQVEIYRFTENMGCSTSTQVVVSPGIEGTSPNQGGYPWDAHYFLPLHRHNRCFGDVCQSENKYLCY